MGRLLPGVCCQTHGELRMVSPKRSGRKKLGYIQARRTRGKEEEGKDGLASSRSFGAVLKCFTSDPNPGEYVDCRRQVPFGGSG